MKTEVTAARARNEALGRALDRWEAEDGAFTAEELRAAEVALGLGAERLEASQTPMKQARRSSKRRTAW